MHVALGFDSGFKVVSLETGELLATANVPGEVRRVVVGGNTLVSCADSVRIWGLVVDDAGAVTGVEALHAFHGGEFVSSTYVVAAIDGNEVFLAGRKLIVCDRNGAVQQTITEALPKHAKNIHGMSVVFRVVFSKRGGGA